MRSWQQQMLDRLITNQRQYGGTIIHSAMARGVRREEQRHQLQEQRAAADIANVAAALAAPDRTARADAGAAGPAGAPRRPTRHPVAAEAKLIPRPRCLYELWQESTSLASATTSQQRTLRRPKETTGNKAISRNTTTEAKFGSCKATCSTPDG
jgi:hypothetical protein